MSFRIIIQNPFEQKERTTEGVNGAHALQLFEQIDWAAIEQELYPREDEVLHYLYFYEIQSEVNGERNTLTITPDFDKDSAVGNDESFFIVRYEYPDKIKPGKYLDYQIHQKKYDFTKQCLQAFINADHQFFQEHFELPNEKGIRNGGCFKKVAILFLVGILGTVAFIHFVIGWQHVPNHIASVKSYFFQSTEPATNEVTEADTVAPVDYAASAPKVLLDTVLWKRQIEAGNFIPDGVREEYEEAVSYDFSHLQQADERPNSEQAEAAIIYRYKDEVRQLLERDHARIRIGKCYKAPLQSRDNGQELARVTAMVCAFDNKGHNLGNIQRPLDIAYDFVQYASDPGTWYITDISQTIPYDYDLNKNKY